MDHDKNAILFCLIIFFLFAPSIQAQIAEGDSIYQPQPRTNTGVVYLPIEFQENTKSLFSENIDTKSSRSLLSSDKQQYIKEIFLPKGPALVGKIELMAVADACPLGDSLNIKVQIPSANNLMPDYETIASGFLHNGQKLTFTLPGRYASWLRIVYEAYPSSQDPITEIQVYEIHLSAATRIMLLGDSITDGKYADDGLGYRKELYHLLLQKGFSIDFVGSYGEAPYEGHFQGGRKVFDFLPPSQGGSGKLDVTWDMDTFRPNVVAIHLGTNDINDGYLPTETLGTLVKYLLRWRDGTRGTELQHIFVSLIIPIKNKDSIMIRSTIETAQLLRGFQQGVITGKQEPVHIVDHFTRFYEDPNLFATYYKSHMADKLHPNSYGHHVMAVTYAEAMTAVLSGQPPWFSERTWETNTAGIDDQFGEQGIAIADANNDGREDIYVSRTAKNSITVRDLYFQNQANGVFQEKAEALGIQDPGDSRGILFADVDNDSDVDLLNGNSPGRNRLYDNLQNATFQDITAISGIDNVNLLTTALLVFDCDSDGDLDFYAVNSRTVNEFYLNNGAGRFTRVNRGANDVEEPDIPSVAASAADFDGDGDIDIYIVKRNAPNKLFINNGNGYFTEGAAAAGIDFNHKSNSACWADLDNDGDSDLVISVSNTSEDPNPMLRFFKNNGNGTFQNISRNINITMDGYSPLLGDFDNDGDIDIITTNENFSGDLYRNNGNWSFSKVANSGAGIYAGDIRGGAVFDYDNDGDLDFYVVRNDVFNVLKRNNLNNGNHYLRVQARGPNRSAIGFGTKIWLYTPGQLGIGEALLGYREVISGTGHISQYSPIQHFGLGNRTSYDLLAQFSDGTFLAYRNGAADQTLIIEPVRPSAGGGGTPADLIAFSGNGQVDTVGQQLPLPLVARVVNAQGLPVSNVRVDFSVIQGQASLILPTTPANDAIWLEAELGRLSGSMRWAYDNSCSNQGFVFHSPLHRTVGYDTFVVVVNQSTTKHAIWARLWNAGNGGVIYYSLDGGNKQAVTITTHNSWQWIKLTPSEGLQLSSGSHKITLESSLYGLQIDKLLVTADVHYIPSGLGEDGNVDPLFSDREGMVRRYLQLGTQAGPIVVQATMQINGQTKSVLFQVTAKAGPPVSIVDAGGNNQTGLPGVPLSQPFVVALKDAYQNPTPGVPVLFRVYSGGGTVMPENGRVITDASGLAQATYTPGRASSLQQVYAEVDGVVGSPVVFKVTVPGIASRIQYLDGNQQSDTVRAVLSKPIKFKITEDNGNPVAGYLVTIKAMDGGQIAVHPTAIRDSLLQILSGQDGTAQIFWRLGPRAGVQTLKIEAPGLIGSPLIITANALATEPYRIFAIDGDGQVDTVAIKLKKPFSVRVTDRYGNPRSGVQVLFKVIRGNGSFSGATQYLATTDGLGEAKAQFTLGTEAGKNIYEIQASCNYNGKSLAGSPLSFWASAHAGKPRFIFIVSGDQQTGVVGTILPKPLVVAVRDFYQNIIIGGKVRFSVTRGNGLLYGESTRWVTTDSSGLASVFFQLGSKAGNNLHEVIAEIDVGGSEFARFTASAVADNPYRLVYLSGNNQAAVANTPLKEPLSVVVLDRYQNPIFNHPVLFEVLSPSGSLGGGRMRDVYTDQDGKASVLLTLGSEVGDSVYVVRASARDGRMQPLLGSPVLFYASGLNSYPVGLWAVTLPYQTLIGTAGKELKDTIKVRVVDEAGRGVPGISVRFEVIKGGGKILPYGTSLATVISGADGIAAARWQLGTSGQIHQLQISANYDGHPLNNSPILYSAIAVPSTAREIRMLSENNPIGTVGQMLPQSIVIQVVDDVGVTVANYPVQIQVKRGGGSLDANNDTLLIKYSDLSGVVTVQWRLGTIAGDTTQLLEISSRDGQGRHLLGSPIQVRAKAMPSAPTLSRSILTVTSPVAANGIDSSKIEAIIRDPYENPIANLPVRFVCSGIAATVLPLQGQTDGQGRFRAIARSNQSGELTIKLQNAANSTDLTLPAVIRFLSREAASMQIVSGDGQSATVTNYLRDPVFVKVIDVFGDPVANAEVQFRFHQGSGEIAPLNGQPSLPPTSLIVTSDKNGIAGVRVKLGIQSGRVMVKATLVSLPDKQQFFTFTALPAAPARLSCLAGDRQLGSTGHRLGQPLTVQLVDLYFNPISNAAIEFVTPENGYFLPGSMVKTDSSGIARVFWYLGSQVGEQKAQAIYQDLQYTFSATALENQPPLLTLPDSTQIFENQPWTLSISIYDAENDSVTLQAENLPAGAHLGVDKRLRWTPSYDQAGRYEIVFTAQDHLGAKQTKKLIIVVLNVNRPPKIDVANSQPPAGNVIVVQKPATIEFRVVAGDLDGDSLNYIWYVNNVLRAVGSSKYRINSEWMPLGNISVKVVVSDRQDTTSLTWQLQIITLVTLTEFTAHAEPYQGMLLYWRTANEKDLLGFYVLRAETQDGPFLPISRLISSQKTGQYQFVDANIQAGVTYYYRLQSINTDGTFQQHAPLQASLPLPTQVQIVSAFPNPFNSHTVVGCSLPQPLPLQVSIFDLLGRQVKELFRADRVQAGYHRFVWDGSDEAGMPVASGIYYCAIKAGEQRQSCKLVLIK